MREKTETERQLSSIVLPAGENSNIKKGHVRQGYEIVLLSREGESNDIQSFDRREKDRIPQVSTDRLVKTQTSKRSMSDKALESSCWLVKARAEASNRSIDMRKIEHVQVSSCRLVNAKAKTERQR